MDDRVRDTLLQAYSRAHQGTDPIVEGVLKKLKTTPLEMAHKVQDFGGQAMENVAQGAGQVGQGLYNFGNETITNVGKILERGGPITQAFGNYNPSIEKYSRGVNYGTDIGVPTGTKVALPQGRWQIIDSNSSGGMNSGYGNSIYAQNLATGEKLRLSHLSQVGVKKGDIVSGGRVIAATGASGNVTGPHLDAEYYDKSGKIANIMNSPYGGNL